MGDKTKIAWANSTASPWIGCTAKSEGCANCYAAEQDRKRFSKTMGGTKEQPQIHFGKGAPRWRCKGFEANVRRLNQASGGPERIVCSKCAKKYGVEDLCKAATIHTFAGMGADSNCSLCGKPNGGASITMPRRRMFPSLCDWLDPEVPIEWLADFLRVIHETPNLDWLLLTKRPENFESRIRAALDLCSQPQPDAFYLWLRAWLKGEPPANVWLGVTAENQKAADERMPLLLQIPARVRWVSAEPLLGMLNLHNFLCSHPITSHYWSKGSYLCENPRDPRWVVVGGESRPRRRDCGVEAITNIAEQCRAAGVPCWVKQDCAAKPGAQGRIPDATWAIKELPTPIH